MKHQSNCWSFCTRLLNWMLICMMYCFSSLADVIAMNESANNIKFLQFKDVQLTCWEMLQWLCWHFQAQITAEARGNLCSAMCWEVSQAFNACWHEVCRAQPGSCNPGLVIELARIESLGAVTPYLLCCPFFFCYKRKTRCCSCTHCLAFLVYGKNSKFYSVDTWNLKLLFEKRFYFYLFRRQSTFECDE